MQLNYASLGARSARRLGSNFINGVSYLALTASYAYSSSVTPALSAAGGGVRKVLPEAKSKINRSSNSTPKDNKGPKA
jgi:hypothetical protein